MPSIRTPVFDRESIALGGGKMKEGNFYEAPKVDVQAQESRGPGRLEAFLRGILLFVFGAYSFFAIIFCFISLSVFAQNMSAKSISSVGNAVFMALFSIMAFISVKRNQSQALTYALLLLTVGFVTTAIYRITFVTDTLGKVDFNNFLIFSVPAALTFLYARLLKKRA